MIKAIITDWHGVVDRKTFESLAVLITKEVHENPATVKDRIKEIATAWTAGVVEPEAFWMQLKSLLNLKDGQIQKLKDYILNIDVDEQVVNFFESNRSNHQIFLLSDCPADKANLIKHSGIFRLFHAASFSCDKHLTKENQDFFLDFLRELKLSASDCLYVDDNKRHINTASSLGFKVCLFERVEDIRAALSYVSKSKAVVQYSHGTRIYCGFQERQALDCGVD